MEFDFESKTVVVAPGTPDLFELVTEHVGEHVEDGAGLVYVVRRDGSFIVAAAPVKAKAAIGQVITATGRLRAVWFVLARQLARAC